MLVLSQACIKQLNGYTRVESVHRLFMCVEMKNIYKSNKFKYGHNKDYSVHTIVQYISNILMYGHNQIFITTITYPHPTTNIPSYVQTGRGR